MTTILTRRDFVFLSKSFERIIHISLHGGSCRAFFSRVMFTFSHISILAIQDCHPAIFTVKITHPDTSQSSSSLTIQWPASPLASPNENPAWPPPQMQSPRAEHASASS